MNKPIKLAFLASTFCVAGLCPAFAQQAENDFARDRDLGVLERPRPEYDAIGIPLDTFLLFPRLNVVSGYNDNIYALPTGLQGDGIVQLQPSVTLKSQWSQHELDLDLHSSINRYFDHPLEDTNDYGAALSGRLDVLASTKLTGSASYDLETEPREAESAARDTISPVQYGLWQSQLAASHQFNRLQISLTGTFDRFDYQDGQFLNGSIAGNTIVGQNNNVLVDEHFRNVEDFGETVRADYALSPDTAVFVSGNLNQHFYPVQPPMVANDFNSHGYQVLGGVNFQITSLVTGEVGAGYFVQDFPSVGGQNLGSFAMNASVQWFPSELTTVTVKADRLVEDSDIQNSAGYVTTGGSVEVDHELRYNVILTGLFEYNDDAYQGIDRDDQRWTAGGGAKYLFTRELGLGLNFYHDSQVSSGTARFVNFDINRVMLNVVLQK
jgi:hypothetical protein